MGDDTLARVERQCDCAEAIAYARSIGGWVVCDECGARVAANVRAERKAATAVRRDADRDAQVLKSALVAEFENLARWPDLAGVGAFVPEPTIKGSAKPECTELPDRVFDRRASRERARETLHRLIDLEQCAALHPEYYGLAARTCRALLERCGSERVRGVTVGAQSVGTSLPELLGRQLATPEQLVKWARAVQRGDSAQARAGMVELGDGAWCLATAIWAKLL